MSENKPYAFNMKRGAIVVGSDKTSAGLNGSFGKGENETDFSWMDVNGDGLPDRVRIGEDKKLHVSLNLGYGFTRAEVWNFDEQTDKNPSRTISIGKGSNESIVRDSISAGVSVFNSENEVDYSLQDVNGDGLPDACYLLDKKVLVRLNSGGGFGALTTWGEASALSRSKGTSMGVNVGFTAGIPLPTPNPMKIIVNASTSAGKSVI
jgi:hypothetical protein